MPKKILHTDHAPRAIGPYSQGVVADDRFIFVSGQIGLDPATGKMVEGGIEAQTTQALENLKAVLEAAGTNLANVVKTTVLMQDIDSYPVINKVYAGYFTENPPARAAFGGLELPAGALVEIECIAIIEK